MIVSLAEAEGQLARLIEQAMAGEEVLIKRAGHPAVRLVPVEVSNARPPLEPRKPGGMEHLDIPDEVFAPMTEDELAEWE